MKQVILTNWTPVRILRMLIAIGILIQATIAKDVLMGIVAAVFAGMALFNTGCCGTNGCTVPTKNIPATLKETSYEEVV